MKMNNLSPAVGAHKERRRVGRGIGSGMGKTATKGHKGQWARSGGGVRLGFEGGQMPLIRRLPKRGFDNAWKKVYNVVNLGDLEAFENGAVITSEVLFENGIIRKLEPYGLKILANGEFTKKLTIKAKKFSKSAVEKIEKLGGKTEVL